MNGKIPNIFWNNPISIYLSMVRYISLMKIVIKTDCYKLGPCLLLLPYFWVGTCAPMTMMAVTVPAGVSPGGVFQVQTPDGQIVAVTCSYVTRNVPTTGPRSVPAKVALHGVTTRAGWPTGDDRQQETCT